MLNLRSLDRVGYTRVYEIRLTLHPRGSLIPDRIISRNAQIYLQRCQKKPRLRLDLGLLDKRF